MNFISTFSSHDFIQVTLFGILMRYHEHDEARVLGQSGYTEGDEVHLKVLNRKGMPVSQKENLIDSNSSSKCNRNRIIWVIYFLYSVHMIMIFNLL